MATPTHALPDPRHGQLGARDGKKHQVRAIARGAQAREPGREVRLARVVSKAKLARRRASDRRRANMTRPAATATISGRKADRPWAMVSALTNSVTARAPWSSRGAMVDLPAPFGPAITTTSGLVAALTDQAPANRPGWAAGVVPSSRARRVISGQLWTRAL